MKKYHVTLIERIERVYEVEAESAAHARQILRDDGPDGEPLSETTHDSEIDDISEVDEQAK